MRRQDTRDLVWLEGGRALHREVEPDREVKKEAMIYVTADGGPVGALQLEVVSEDLPAAFNEGWHPDDSARYLWMETPPGVEPWRYSMMEVRPEDFLRFLGEVTIIGERAHWLTDYMHANLPLISGRMRAVIEELDGEASYFWPAIVKDRETGAVLSEDYSFWMPQRRLWYSALLARGTPQQRIMPFEGAFGSMGRAWQLTYRAPVRQFAASLPIWGMGLGFHYVAFSAPVFKRMKAEGFTGLVEIPPGKYEEKNPERDRWESVGHF